MSVLNFIDFYQIDVNRVVIASLTIKDRSVQSGFEITISYIQRTNKWFQLICALIRCSINSHSVELWLKEDIFRIVCYYLTPDSDLLEWFYVKSFN